MGGLEYRLQPVDNGPLGERRIALTRYSRTSALPQMYAETSRLSAANLRMLASPVVTGDLSLVEADWASLPRRLAHEMRVREPPNGGRAIRP
jgi:hypothetical protein